MSVASAALCLANAATLPRLRPPRRIEESVVVCVPARDEEGTLPHLISDLRAQRRVDDLHVIVLDDASNDNTLLAARAAMNDDSRFAVVPSSTEPPPGWTGKAAACRTLAALAFDRHPETAVIVFVDADVRLGPDAIASAVASLRDDEVALVCPWPEQLADGLAEHLVQPLLGFAWMSTLVVRAANCSLRPSTVVACGQMMVFDASSYRGIGGHASVAGSATEDLAIARVLRRHGRRTTVVSGAGSVSCRMYDGWHAVRGGYTRWLWTAFGGRAGTAAVLATMTFAYLIPPMAAVAGTGRTRRIGAVGYAAAVLSRTVAGLSESENRHLGRIARGVAIATTHPASVVLYGWLSIESHRRHERGMLQWKHRPLVGPASDASGRES